MILFRQQGQAFVIPHQAVVVANRRRHFLEPSISPFVIRRSRHHEFNGGYGASIAGRVQWNPMQAAEFVLWHAGDVQEIGHQLRPLNQDWSSGSDVVEFLHEIVPGTKRGRELQIDLRIAKCTNTPMERIGG